MRPWRIALCLLLLPVCDVGADANLAPVATIKLVGAIGPASSDYVIRALADANAQHAQLLVIEIDTPGGLDSAMRRIVQTILAAPIPIATYVAPSGARAASAGTYIMYASHVAAMAPGTNLGAATPVSLGAQPAREKGGKDARNASADPMAHKLMNDAIAYIRGLATLRGRNADWAELAVRDAASLHAEAALKRHVIDMIARDLPDLLAQLQGRRVTVMGDTRTLNTAGAAVISFAPDWRTRLLSVIADPNVAYILMLLGIYGLFFEFWNPGFVLPGVVGAISLLLALFAFQTLPVSYAGVGLIALGIAFMIAEAHVPSFGVLGFGGIVAFLSGSVLLFDNNVPGLDLAWPIIAVFAIVSTAFFIIVGNLALRARRRPVTTGAEQLLDMVGVAAEDFVHKGRIHIRGEDWQAQSAVPIVRGQRVRVRRVQGLTLIIEPEVS